MNRYHKERREPQAISIEELDEKFHRSLKADDQIGRLPTEPGGAPAWTDRDVETAVGELPETFRSAVLLVDVEELSYEEASAALNCPIGTLRSRLFRARKLLAIALHDYARRAGYIQKDAKDE